MNRIDGVILGVGVVVLAASILGVVLYDEAGGNTYNISWGEGEAVALDEQSDSGGPGEYTFDVAVNETNIAQMVFTVDVTANGPQVSDDSVEVAVEGPDGMSGDCSFGIPGGSQTGSGTCDASVDVTEAPDAATVRAQNQSAAEEDARDQVSTTDGQGTWTVTVTVDGGTEIQDPNYDVTVNPVVSQWTPVVEIPGTGSGPGPG